MDIYDIAKCGLFVICIITVFLVAFAIYQGCIAVRNKKFLRYEEFRKKVKVVGKDFKDSKMTYVPMTTTVGNSIKTIMKPQFENEEFNVYLLYKGSKYCFDNEAMFNSLDVGDKVDVVVHEGYNRKGELKNIYLSTIDE